jgi:ribosomal protein L11 methyltransferase
MIYQQYQFFCPPDIQEILIAQLGEWPFEVFEEQDECLMAYIPEQSDDDALLEFIEALRENFGFRYHKETIPDQNWNAVWEQNFQPVVVDDFCAVRAEFHEPIPGVQYELVIQPRMAFGTGHHATTEMMIRTMQSIDFKGKSVFDFGCGTGILAILAAKMGATDVEAVDIEQESYDNTILNAGMNRVPDIETWCGVITAVPERQYDIILANINRNVLLDNMKTMAQRLISSGILLLSGILEADYDVIVAAAAAENFRITGKRQQGDWLCLSFVKQ